MKKMKTNIIKSGTVVEVYIYRTGSLVGKAMLCRDYDPDCGGGTGVYDAGDILYRDEAAALGIGTGTTVYCEE
jgi:hypothetical protein